MSPHPWFFCKISESKIVAHRQMETRWADRAIETKVKFTLADIHGGRGYPWAPLDSLAAVRTVAGRAYVQGWTIIGAFSIDRSCFGHSPRSRSSW